MSLALCAEGAELVSRYGLYDDGWCSPACAFGLVATSAVTELTLGLWIMPQEGMPDRHSLAVQVEGGPPVVHEVSTDILTEIAVACVRSAGEAAIITVRCSSRVANSGPDTRSLSFVLNAVTLK